VTVNDARQLKGWPYELFILLVSILSVVNLIVVAIWSLAPGGLGSAGEVIVLMDLVVTPIFLFDFLFRLLSAPSRATYFVRGFGWLDLAATFPLLRLLRVVAIIRVARAMNAYGRMRVAESLDDARAVTTFLLTAFMVLVVVEVAGASIFAAEMGAPNANIVNAGDAIWWGLVTITTVGYGDEYPVTAAGRVIGTFLLIAGIALFSVLTGFIANAFLTPRRLRSARRLHGEQATAFDELRQMLVEQDRRSDEMRRKLDDLERTYRLIQADSSTESTEQG